MSSLHLIVTTLALHATTHVLPTTSRGYAVPTLKQSREPSHHGTNPLVSLPHNYSHIHNRSSSDSSSQHDNTHEVQLVHRHRVCRPQQHHRTYRQP